MAKRQGIMLCYPFEERRLTEKKFGWTWPVCVQPKLDGERGRTLDDVIGLQSSTAAYINSVPHIEDALIRIQDMVGFPLMFDGEFYKHGWTFNEIASVVGRTVNLHDDYQMIEYHVFDYMHPAFAQHARIAYLNTVFEIIRKGLTEAEWLSFPIKLVPTEPAFNLDQMYKLGMKWINSDYEGFVVRSGDLRWEAKRSNKIMKFKPKKNDLYTVIEVLNTVSETGELLDMAGGFRCMVDDQSFKVGAGKLTHEERKAIWEMRNDCVGKMLNVQYQSLTAGGNASGVPRFGIATSIPFKQNVITV